MSAPVHALLDDLFFRSRIEATAAAAGVGLLMSRTLEELREKIDASGAGGVLVDLGMGTREAVEAIRALKQRSAPPIVVVAWGSHVDSEALEGARAAGADRVLARSAFTRRLPDLLRELAG